MAERGFSAVNQQDLLTFKTVQLFKNETLGTGSYGVVCKAKCDQLMCAAKLIWPALLQVQAPDPGKEHRHPFQRFESECKLVSRFNHPNIVQYLGTYRDPETNTPVLLMELMDESLTHFLESSAEDIPHHVQVNLASDIAQALVFLHANGIIHRDLSSNNVLLIAGSRAKVTDFGMFKLNSTNTATMTSCPGTPVFMSPEALSEPPVYTEKLDNFSFGVLLIQIVTRLFPEPSDRFETIQVPNPRNPKCTTEAKIAIPEVKRRQAHISVIDPNHPFLHVALDCLKDQAVERPSSQQLCESLNALKEAAYFKESLKQDARQLLRAKSEQLQARNEQLQTKNEQLQAKEEQLQARNEQLQTKDQQLSAKDEQIRMKCTENDELKLQLESSEDAVLALQETIAKQAEEVVALRNRIVLDSLRPNGIHNPPPQQQDAPTPLTGDKTFFLDQEHLLHDPKVSICTGQSAVIGDKAYNYVGPSGQYEIYEFDCVSRKWNSLPSPSPDLYTIVSVDRVLTTVGGQYRVNSLRVDHSNELFSYIKKKWVKNFPPMPTKRRSPAAVYANHYLVVAGGINDIELSIVEVLNTRRKKWYTVSCLPFPTNQPSLTICGDYIYLHAGFSSPLQEKHSVLRCSLQELVKSRPTSPKSAWERLSPLPVCNSSLVSVGDQLLAFGGSDSENQDSNYVYHYKYSTGSWEEGDYMILARSQCVTVSLPKNGTVLVMGGFHTDTSIEIHRTRFT